MIWVLRVSSVSTTEMPMLLPMLRMRLNIAVPSLRSAGESVANADGRQRHVDKARAEALQRNRTRRRCAVSICRSEAGHLPQRKAVSAKPTPDEQARVDLAHHASHNEHREQACLCLAAP